MEQLEEAARVLLKVLKEKKELGEHFDKIILWFSKADARRCLREQETCILLH